MRPSSSIASLPPLKRPLILMVTRTRCRRAPNRASRIITPAAVGIPMLPLQINRPLA